MSVTYYAWAAATAPGLVAAEAAIDRWRGRRAARSFGDRVNGASHVAGEMVLVAILGLDVFAAYEWLMPRLALFTPSPSSPLTWVAAFVALDFAYWVGHRACHRFAVLWALHAVHHQQRGYGLSVGLRGPWLSALQIAPFMIPLAVLGLPPSVLFPMYAAHAVYKLLVHADVRRRLGALEGWLVTPSSHRVHHATVSDVNFGGVLAVWDRLFGTHREDGDATTDGPALAELDPIANNLAPWRTLLARVKERRGVVAKLGVVFGRPVEDASAVPGAPREVSTNARVVAFGVLAAAAAAAACLVASGGTWPFAGKLAVGGSVIAALSWNARFVGRGSRIQRVSLTRRR
jgi:sterol desaturase/sphingolipid hydroxylase (fatty acid hydroxylase superfamily)